MKNNQNLIDLLNNNYVTVIADISNGAKVPVDLPFRGNTPTMMVVTPNGNLIAKPIEGDVPSGLIYIYLKRINLLKNEYEKSKGMVATQ